MIICIFLPFVTATIIQSKTLKCSCLFKSFFGQTVYKYNNFFWFNKYLHVGNEWVSKLGVVLIKMSFFVFYLCVRALPLFSSPHKSWTKWWKPSCHIGCRGDEIRRSIRGWGGWWEIRSSPWWSRSSWRVKWILIWWANNWSYWKVKY